jgi:hypothetical protein
MSTGSALKKASAKRKYSPPLGALDFQYSQTEPGFQREPLKDSASDKPNPLDLRCWCGVPGGAAGTALVLASDLASVRRRLEPAQPSKLACFGSFSSNPNGLSQFRFARGFHFVRHPRIII